MPYPRVFNVNLAFRKGLSTGIFSILKKCGMGKEMCVYVRQNSAKILLTCFKYRRPVVVHDSLA